MLFTDGPRPLRSTAPAARAGFTLLEIMVALTIFSIITIAVYSTFRVGLRSYERGREQMVVTQTARVVFDQLARELHSLYYLPPERYNREIIGQLQRHLTGRFAGVDPRTAGLRDRARRRGMRWGQTDNLRSDDQWQPSGIPIDLTIVGKDGDDLDSITFVCYQPNWGLSPVEPWALARVKYFVEDGDLFRAEGPIAVDEVPSFQWTSLVSTGEQDRGRRNRLAETEPDDRVGQTEDYLADAPRELLARNIKIFDLQYGYWTDEGWQEAPDWVAHERRYRNPPREINPDSPNADLLMALQNAMPTDDVPAYVTVTLGVGYGKNNERTQIFRSRIRLLSSVETYRPFFDPAQLGLGPYRGTTRKVRPGDLDALLRSARRRR